MAATFILRRAHVRRLANGRSAFVREAQVLVALNSERKPEPRRRPCPQCGAAILRSRMPNGGWGHFEGGAGLSRIKHPCFDRRGRPRGGRDGQTLDLFDQDEPSDMTGPRS